MFRQILPAVLLYFYILGVNCQNPEVQIPQGRLRGATRTNIDGGIYYSFQNVPYGKPPIGELRFRAPEAADSWEGTRDATEDLPWCVQQGNIMGQEDCLYLNVYTPGLPQDNVTQLPVMVWIHGGAFYGGSASEASYGAQFILTEDVVLVAINYRLGIFGFLSLDDPNLGVTGNAGLKDQVLALEWIRDNIERFGGDPNNVLIFGESAGSMSVQFLLLSPSAKGLFHKAICQSGDTLTELLVPVTRNNGEAIAEALGIQTENWRDMLDSLREASPSDLALAELSFDVGFYQLFAAPTVEIPSSGALLDRRPLDIIRSGDYNKVPFIMGINDAEGLLFQLFSRQANGESLLIEDFNTFVPSEFGIEGTVLEDLIALVIRDFYYGDVEPSRDDITQAVELTTDYAFAFPCYRTATEYLKTAEDPIYFYYFTTITSLSFLRQMDETVAAFPGAAHADDLGYLFYMTTTPSFAPGSVEDLALRNMVNLWTNFAKYDNPTPDDTGDVVWEPTTENQFNYLHIGTEETFLVENSVFTQDRMEFWSSLYDQFGRK